MFFMYDSSQYANRLYELITFGGFYYGRKNIRINRK